MSAPSHHLHETKPSHRASEREEAVWFEDAALVVLMLSGTVIVAVILLLTLVF